jgi:hypothetical protein
MELTFLVNWQTGGRPQSVLWATQPARCICGDDAARGGVLSDC